MKQAKWNKIRAEIKLDFDRMNIRFCEQCGGTFALGFAHRLKRRYITDDEELRKVALLCQKCHEEIEFSGHDPMFEAITDIITKRADNFDFGA